MRANQIPTKFPLPFAANAGAGMIRPIPVLSQIGVTNGAASLTDGFVPANFTPVSAGGTPPFGQDFNGLLNQITAWNQWQNAGGTVQYDSTFQAAIGGYPQGAIVSSATTFGNFWLCSVDNNLTNPDTGGAGWLALNWLGTGTVSIIINQAQSQPLYPEITNVGNVFSGTSSTGQVVLATGMKWAHRGLDTYDSTVLSAGQRTFATIANKTYHLRWYPSGFGRAFPGASFPNGVLFLEDLADPTYNPGSLAETDPSFDSSYDNMLAARVVTNGSNVPTVLYLVNKMLLASSSLEQVAGGNGMVELGFGAAAPNPTPASSPRIWFDDRTVATVGVNGDGDARVAGQLVTNWARTPKISPTSCTIGFGNNSGCAAGITYVEGGDSIISRTVTRYSTVVVHSVDFNLSGIINSSNAFTLSGTSASVEIDLLAN